ncbi:hypothetical protein [Polyangium jinanense]|uniref:Helix-turn-helix domain-containing protein n=1 Tax=Polyangium jinanense TaxID=2829994 RepID=A0A9X3XB84_9BACT|nr:hypothetical protein [Polyangium jinanense]MDC3962517.1 hypothetical protein [Polyangium jinanense]MDC3986065.1 hypothetical protein [Polyangium jinanense]
MSDSRAESTTTIMATLAIPPNALRITAPPPDTISQRNVEAMTGIPPRVFLEVVRAPGFPLPVTRLGKLRIVNRAAFVAWVEQGAFRAAPPPPPIADAAGELEGESAGEILEAVGLTETSRRAAGRARSPRP